MNNFIRNTSFALAFIVLISIFPPITVSAYTQGDSFKIYSNPKYTKNSDGTSEIWALSPGADTTGTEMSAYIRARFFQAGDGIIHKPAKGSLDGLSTTVTIRHRVGKFARPTDTNATNVWGAPWSFDSDLAAMVTYMEDGIIKKSPSFRFTGFHYNNKQDTKFGPENTLVDFNIGTYPNVISVNVYHMLSDPIDKSHGVGSQSTPYHEYVQFDVSGPAAAAELPDPETYYIEETILPNSELGVPKATPMPAAQKPVKPGMPMPALVPPQPVVTNSPVVPIGVGESITLFSAEGATLPPAVNGVIEDAAPVLNMNDGVTRIEIGAGGTASGVNSYGLISALIGKSLDTKVIFTPRDGLLDGTVTEVTVFQHTLATSAKGLEAVVVYDNGKTDTVTYYPANYTPKYNSEIFTIGSYLNVESVTIVPKVTSNLRVPSVTFRVVNDNPEQPAPGKPVKKYQAPNISTRFLDDVNITPSVPVPDIADSGLYINEVCSNNKTVIRDGDIYPNVIEIYNSGSTPADISGYGISDNAVNPMKRKIPEGTFVPEGGYLLIYASNKYTATEKAENIIRVDLGINEEGEVLTLSNRGGQVLDVVDVPALKENTSLARVPDGGNNFNIITPALGVSNNNAEFISNHIYKPEFSKQSGFYENPFDLTISSPAGTVYYTTDGSEPRPENVGKAPESPKDAVTYVYQNNQPLRVVNRTNADNVISMIKYISSEFVPAVKIDKTTVIRAAAFDNDGNSSEVVTKTYFVGYDMIDNFNNTMIISMCTDAENLFDDGYGIFTNYDEQQREWERRVHVDVFDESGSIVINQDAGARVRGFGYKGLPQKGINFHARSEYGAKRFDYPLFDDAHSIVDGSLVQSHKSFALKNGSTHYGGAVYTDGLAQYLSADLGTGYQSQRPAILFINGEYWGVYYMAERLTDDYVESYYGIPKEDVILIKNHYQSGDAVEEDRLLYQSDRTFLRETDFRDPANFAELTKRFDIENLMMYYASNMNAMNIDWRSFNFACWRSRYVTDKPYEDGKWRFLMYDLDRSFDTVFKPLGSMQADWGLALMSNPSLKEMYANLLLDTYNNNFSPINVTNEHEYWSGEYVPVFNTKMQQRWNVPEDVSGSVTRRYNALTVKKPDHLENLKSLFELTGGYVHMSAKVNDRETGKVKVNLMNPSTDYNGRYFTGATQKLTAIPEPGCRFVGWTYTEGTQLSSETDETTYVTLALNGSAITANFERRACYISSASELSEAAARINSDPEASGGLYILTNDIEFAGENNFTAMGTESLPFTGIFDGGFHTINGINITAATQGQGLFGYLGTGGVVKNVGVTNINIDSSNKNAGGIAGRNLGTIENCYTTGVVKGASTTGGIAGNNTDGGAIKNCHSTASINSNGKTGGGIAGKTEFGSEVINCYSLHNPPVGNIDEATGGSAVYTFSKTLQEFADGTVTGLLNENGTKNVWTDGADFPVFANNAEINLSCRDGIIEIESSENLHEVCLIIGSYDDGLLIDIKIIKMNVVSGTPQTVPVPEDLSREEGGIVKAMLWNQMGKITPLTAFTSAE